MLHRVILAGLSSCLLALAFGASQPASAQGQATVHEYCWIDSATGKRVPTKPAGIYGQLMDPNHAYNSTTGQNFNQQPDGTWVDSATGQPVDTMPESVTDPVLPDPAHAHNTATGQNFVRVPCPPPTAAGATSSEKEKPKEQPERKEAGLGSEPTAAETTSAKPSEEPKKVEEKKEPSWWESLIPALIPSIGIGVGRDRERRAPRNPCAGK